jgi:hypothetical protein
MLKPTLLQSQLFRCPPWDDLGDLLGFPIFENILKSRGDVGLLTESQSDKPLRLDPTNRPGTVKKELALWLCPMLSDWKCDSEPESDIVNWPICWSFWSDLVLFLNITTKPFLETPKSSLYLHQEKQISSNYDYIHNQITINMKFIMQLNQQE